VRQGVAGEVKQLAGSVDFLDACCKIIQLVKIIVAHPQAVAGHACIHGIGTVGDRIAQVVQVAGRGQQFSRIHGSMGQGSKLINVTYYKVMGGRVLILPDISRKCAPHPFIVEWP
jgi:hypothetical protein